MSYRPSRLPAPDERALGPERHRMAAATALILVVVVALGYVCSPLDLLPDAIPIVGWLDDAVALLLSSAGVAVSASYLQGHDLRDWRGTASALLRERAARWALVVVVAATALMAALAALAMALLWLNGRPGGG